MLPGFAFLRKRVYNREPFGDLSYLPYPYMEC